MVGIQGRVKGLADRGKWMARGASFVAKLKATKVVWFPPRPVKAGKETAATAKETTKGATKKATSAVTKTTSGSEG